MSASIVSMLDSGSIVQIDATRFAASAQALDDRVADLAARRGEVGDAVDQLVRGWRGEASAAFRGHWEAWRDGADRVIDDLRRDVAALPLVQGDLDRGDAHSSHVSTRLHGRLG